MQMRLVQHRIASVGSSVCSSQSGLTAWRVRGGSCKTSAARWGDEGQSVQFVAVEQGRCVDSAELGFYPRDIAIRRVHHSPVEPGTATELYPNAAGAPERAQSISPAGGSGSSPAVSGSGTVHAQDLGVRNGRAWIFRHLDVEVAAGTLVAVHARRGRDRVPLLLALAGRIRVSEGTVHVAGLDVRHHRRAVRRLVGLGEMANVNDLEYVKKVVTRHPSVPGEGRRRATKE